MTNQCIDCQICAPIGLDRFCAVVSDSTGNTKLARHLFIEQAVLAFDIPDICHPIHNVLKEIFSCDAFAGVSSRHFHS